MTFCDVNWCFGEMQVTEKIGGPERDRTAGLLVANEALSQHPSLLNQSLPDDFLTNKSIQLERKWNVRKLVFASTVLASPQAIDLKPMKVIHRGGGTYAD